MRWRELVALCLWTLLADWLIFRTWGYLLYQQLALHNTRWTKYLDGTANRKAAIESFQNYAMQWY